MAIHRTNHRATHPPILILQSDTAWHTERIKAERERFDAWVAQQATPLAPNVEPLPPMPWSTWDEHPVELYRSGASRYDVATIQDWLLPGVQATAFHLKRMAFPRWEAWQGYLEQVTSRGGATRQLIYALRHGFAWVELDPETRIEADPERGLSDAQIDQLRREIGDEQFGELCRACAELQRSVTPSEAFR